MKLQRLATIFTFAMVTALGGGSAQAQSASVSAGGLTVYYDLSNAVAVEAPQPVNIATPPPAAPAYATVVDPAPIPGQLWVRGHWAWTGAQWAWVPGRYIVARPGCTWISPYYDPYRQIWIRGHWRPGQVRPSYVPVRLVYYVPGTYVRRNHPIWRPVHRGPYLPGVVYRPRRPAPPVVVRPRPLRPARPVVVRPRPPRRVVVHAPAPRPPRVVVRPRRPAPVRVIHAPAPRRGHRGHGRGHHGRHGHR